MMNEKVRKVLDKYQTYQPGFKVQRFIDFPCPWISYDDKDFEQYLEKYGEPNHREILEDEIVIDVDAEVIEDGVIHADMVEDRLKEYGLFYKRFKSGGSGQHFHLIFPELPDFFSKEYLEDVKYVLIEYLLQGLINPKNLDSHICLFKKKLIQIEHALHRKGKVKELVSYNLGLNTIPSDFFSFLEAKMKKRFEIMTRIDSIKQPDNLNCINYLEGKTVNDLNYFSLKRVNYRALFALAAYYKNKYETEENVKDKLMEWYNSIPVQLKRNSIATVNTKQINILSKRSNGSAGCLYRLSLLEELGIDDKICKNCPYYFVSTNK